MANCTCPRPATISDIPQFTCPEELGQIQRLGFMRGSFTNFAAAPVDLTTDWTPKLTAADDEHVVITPLIEGFTIPSGEPITEGGDDNTTLNGNPVVVGDGQIVASGMGRQWNAAIVTALKELACEPDLQMFMINEFGQLIMSVPTGTEHKGFPAFNFFIGSKDVQGKNTHNKNPFQFNLRADWADQLVIVEPVGFDPLLPSVFN